VTSSAAEKSPLRVSPSRKYQIGSMLLPSSREDSALTGIICQWTAHRGGSADISIAARRKLVDLDDVSAIRRGKEPSTRWRSWR
jgi:hypothetical protein